ncbi:MAG: DNA alkylation repair protein [Candidatus Woykebacteria bacterium GWA1_44_8]|uniref:DNA alkylation repair protein n=1 Tax=Candidatus Woykebacteria bacterium GWA1_44_8 TaxID=1802591 RepID=A0A1G1W4W8_9BACT|nr:MAG: DNA alkylation repair protein [Candidatus Woykebacteria bacterium GWA1_44_8]
MTAKEIIDKLRSKANPKNVEGMARFGINPENTLGIPIPVLRKTAKEIGKDTAFTKASAVRHILAQELWDSGIHEVKILAAMVDDPKQVTTTQMDSWVKDFDSWDVCDQVCMNLFDRTSVAYDKAKEWAEKEEEFTRRAGFALMACLAWHDKTAPDEKFLEFFPLIRKYSTDERNFVKKAVNWALRQIGKGRPKLLQKAIELAKEIEKIDSKSAKWIAKDAIRELSAKKIKSA